MSLSELSGSQVQGDRAIVMIFEIIKFDIDIPIYL